MFSKNFYLTIIFTLLSTLPIMANAQTTISGTIQDLENNPLPFVNILLLQPADSTLIRGAISNEKGQFELNAEGNTEYLIRFSFIGYNDLYANPEVGNAPVDMGVITMEESTYRLGEVTIAARRPLFEQKIDRTVMNVAGSITASSGSILDILEKAPGVSVDRANNAISMAGKQGVRVMVNGRMSQMPLAALTQMLNGMNAESVERIELITTPPARFEAEGDAGIINIVMKRTADVGTNGSFSLFGGYGERAKAGSSLNFNHRNRNLNIFGNYSFRYNKTEQIVSNFREIAPVFGNNEITDTRSYRVPLTLAHNGNLGVDYRIGNTMVLGTNVSAFDSRWLMDAINDVNMRNNNMPSYYIRLENEELNQIRYYVGSFNISKDLGARSNIFAELSYIKYDSHNPNEYLQTFEDFDGSNTLLITDQLRSEKTTPLYTWVPSIDYRLNIQEGVTFEAGLKGSFNNLENDVRVQNRDIGEVWRTDPDFTQMVFLNENILAAYSSMTYKVTETFDVMAGLRYEYTLTDLFSEVETNILYRKYGNFFPSLFFSKRFDDNRSGVLSYSRRISRPTFNDLAPFVIFLDPNTFWSGNEALRPSITDAVRAEFRWNTFLFTLLYSHDKDAIARFQPRMAADGQTQLISVDNIDSRDTYSINAALPFDLTSWWNMRYNINGSYMKMNTNQLGVPFSINAYSVSVNGQMNFTLPRDYTIELTGIYWSPVYQGVSKLEPVSMMNIGLGKQLPNQWGTIRLTVSDVFETMGRKASTYIPERNIFIRTDFAFEGRVVNLTWTYNFGYEGLQRLRNIQSRSQEEQQRIQ